MNEQTKRTSMLDVGTEASRIDDYVKRPMRSEKIDGLGELCAGFIWMGFTLLEAFQMAAPSNSIWHHKATFFVCLAVLVIGTLYGLSVLKRHITYPRTGYVKYREAGPRGWRMWLMASGSVVAYMIIIKHTKLHSFEIAAVALASAALGLIYALGTPMDAAWRWVVLVALIVAPPVVAALPLGKLWSGNLPFMLQGLIFSLSGAIALALYLRRNPVPEQVAD